MNETSISSAQRMYARLAGFVYLFNYAANVFGVLVPSRIKGTGTFAESAERVLASEHLYRTALTSMTIAWASLVVLSFALYVALEPVNKRLARLALFFRLGEAFVGGVTVMWSFATLRLYTISQDVGSALQDEQLQALASVTGSATDSGFFIAWMFFGPGSFLFFYLFYKSGYIPRVLAALGMLGSVVMLLGNLVALVFPEYISMVQYGWAPIGIAEITTAFWLMIVGLRSVGGSKRNAA
ncbi:DUF4386 domain-containing protein [Pseudoxanthomonas putridarboris]|uniref:DUF4386 domain-containing protein n=1 Tax=Pseudoxanthomonas putridarboris TaxID=752605 RepID=A0ABU9J2K9_9GAMM